MFRSIYLIISVFLIVSCNNPNQESTKLKLNTFLNDWHKAAANADLQTYIGSMAEQSTYIGTDATENWTRSDFKKFCKPYFDGQKTWNFTPLERNVYIGTNIRTAWFDELLNTQMGICRGSGNLKKINNEWKITHYVLSMTIPNDNSNEITKLKKEIDSSLLLNYDKALTD